MKKIIVALVVSCVFVANVFAESVKSEAEFKKYVLDFKCEYGWLDNVAEQAVPKDWYWLRYIFDRESLCWDELVYLFNDYGAYLIDYHDVYVNYLRMKCFDKKRLVGWDNFMNYRSRETSGVLFGAKVKNWLAMQLIEYNNVDVTVCVFEQIAKYGDASFMDTLQDMVNVSSDKDTSNVQYVLNVLSDLRKDMENNTAHE